ncbi:hypothetical protein BDK51DRAFT_43719 [Blyttiomyces helicus]|uniref:Mitochondrial import receptor subunit TOM7 n=1 Tax=Blyttiomyces helicus TaxID=388810 RepID=A0A4P9WB01_9FUNG|nr:hypothetical protein BDK51DRAFT_43719 [Blyttiomyces helicus]|eukprot:RKO87436.1 hypothetical protein BDK51DRAFT_43719 [Blyttiomyces helicus]
MQDETRERIIKFIDWAKKAVHVGFIPLVLYIVILGVNEYGSAHAPLPPLAPNKPGYTRSIPRPSLLRILVPLAG